MRVIPNVFPGYNNRASGGTTYAIPRRYAAEASPTSTFRELARWAERYVDPQLNAVCVTSFNEWHEDTQIEPTIVSPETSVDDSGARRYTGGYRYRGYGTEYLELLRDLYGPSQDPRGP